MELQISKKEMSALFEKAKWTFELSKEEILNLTNLLNRIEKCSYQDYFLYGIHNGIAAFGLCTKPTSDNIALIEKFVNTEYFCDPVTSVALKVLCSSSYWDLAGNYEDLLCKFIQMDDESYEETVNVAIGCMGSYCHTTKNKTYISLLFSLFNKALKDYCDKESDNVSSIGILYNSLESVIWGNKYPKNRNVTLGEMKILIRKS
ncbi:hypothetical protein [Prevotella sp. HCN-7019]|uniref:hypothetical protein n=1 Tax=Prevotella sp. HCN-7019 TaxID=3134668 RepID=UPI0030C036D4